MGGRFLWKLSLTLVETSLRCEWRKPWRRDRRGVPMNGGDEFRFLAMDYDEKRHRVRRVKLSSVSASHCTYGLFGCKKKKRKKKKRRD